MSDETAVGVGVLDGTARRLLLHLARAQTTGRLPSVVAGVLRDGRPVWFGHRGAHPAPGHDPQDVQHRIGSITKTFTAVLVLQLVRDGRLDLDEPLTGVLGDVGYADRTVRSLLAHDSGMQSEPAGSWWERSPGVGWDELVAANDGSSAVFPSHQQFHYSNLGYALLGQAVARVHGRSWWECVEERLLRPLGMRRTTYLPDGAAAQGWSVHPYAGTLTAEPATDTAAMAPAGQAWSTAADVATWASFLLDGHAAVLERSWLELATHPQAGDRHDALASAHGLGLQLFRGGSGMLVGHTGSMPGFLAACLVDPVGRTGAVVLANATAGFAPGGLAATLVEELERCEPALPGPWRPTESVPDQLADLLGVWHWGNTAFVWTLEGAEVVVRRDGEEKHRFAVLDGGVRGTRGYHAGEPLHVVRRSDGTVSHLEVATFVFTRTPYDPDAPVPGGHPGRPEQQPEG